MSETIENEKYKDLDISDKWKGKFRILEKAGSFSGVTYENNKSLSPSERRKIGFNILAFFFGSLYYFSKKMHYKAAFILGAGFLFSTLLTLLETTIGISIPSIIYWVVPAAIVASIANYDYFKFMTKNETMWAGFPSMFSNILGGLGFPAISFLFLLIVSGLFNVGLVGFSPLSESKAWEVSDTTDPITDLKTLSAFKIFTVDSIEIQTKLSCNTSSLETKSVAFEFNFFTADGTAQQVRQTAHMGKGRYRINLTSYVRRLGTTKAETVNSAIRYSNQVTDNISKIKVNKSEQFIYKFYLASGEPTIQFSSNERGLNNVLKACGSLKNDLIK